jgi:tripartite-type tricarboxylate transporter receptor subunit TctC
MHKITVLKKFLLLGLTCLVANLAVYALAVDNYPAPGREVRHIMPWGAGGGTDTAMRGFMQYFERYLGVPIYTDNITGGLGSIGWLTLKDAPADGYTIGTVTYDILTVEFQGMAPVSWEDFEVIATITDHATALVTRADHWETLEEFVEEANSRPGQIRVANAGTGGVWHQHAVAMEEELGIELRHIAYESAAPQVVALLGGEVEASVMSFPAVLSQIREGEVRVLAIMAEERDPQIPEAPTFRELGYEVVYGSFRMIAAPNGTPEAIISHLEETAEQAFNDPEFQEWAERTAIGAVWRNRTDSQESVATVAPRIRDLMERLGLTN